MGDAEEKLNKAMYYQKNKESIAERTRLFRESNREQMRERDRLFRAASPYTQTAARNRNRAKTIGAPGDHTGKDLSDLLKKQNGRCANPRCAAVLILHGEKKFHFDHSLPLSRGGTNGIENMQALCAPCNNQKHDRTPEEWAALNWAPLAPAVGEKSLKRASVYINGAGHIFKKEIVWMVPQSVYELIEGVRHDAGQSLAGWLVAAVTEKLERDCERKVSPPQDRVFRELYE